MINTYGYTALARATERHRELVAEADAARLVRRARAARTRAAAPASRRLSSRRIVRAFHPKQREICLATEGAP